MPFPDGINHGLVILSFNYDNLTPISGLSTELSRSYVNKSAG